MGKPTMQWLEVHWLKRRLGRLVGHQEVRACRLDDMVMPRALEKLCCEGRRWSAGWGIGRCLSDQRVGGG